MEDPDQALLDSARQGSSAAFNRLTTRHRRALLAHCYRMLGSLADAEDAVQEVFVRAWQHLASFESRASLKSWLFVIASRVCIDLGTRRSARRLPLQDDVAASDPTRPPQPPVTDPIWISPLPDAELFDGDGDERESPEAVATRRESVGLAFLAALHLLPASQRAALLLHDVAGWQAAEVADALDTTVTAVNSSLQRARRTLDERAGVWRAKPRIEAQVESDALARYVGAWERGDPKALATLLRDDVTLSMPPMPDWYAGRASAVTFLSTFVFTGGARFKLVPTAHINGSPAVVSYREDPTAPGRFNAEALHILTLSPDGQIADVVVFLSRDDLTRARVTMTLDERAPTH